MKRFFVGILRLLKNICIYTGGFGFIFSFFFLIFSMGENDNAYSEDIFLISAGVSFFLLFIGLVIQDLINRSNY